MVKKNTKGYVMKNYLQQIKQKKIWLTEKEILKTDLLKKKKDNPIVKLTFQRWLRRDNSQKNKNKIL